MDRALDHILRDAVVLSVYDLVVPPRTTKHGGPSEEEHKENTARYSLLSNRRLEAMQ